MGFGVLSVLLDTQPPWTGAAATAASPLRAVSRCRGPPSASDRASDHRMGGDRSQRRICTVSRPDPVVPRPGVVTDPYRDPQTPLGTRNRDGPTRRLAPTSGDE